MKGKIKKLISLTLALILVLGTTLCVSADGGNNKIENIKDKSKIEEVKSIKDDLKIFKITNIENKSEKYVLMNKVHNQNAPKNLPKSDEKIDIVTDKSNEAQGVWIDRVYFKVFDTLDEAEEMANTTIEVRPNAETVNMSLATSSADLGNGSYIERGYSSTYGYYFHIHWSADDTSYYKDTLTNWNNGYWVILGALTWIGGGITGIPGTVVATVLALISNQMIYNYYYQYKNTDGSFDIYVYDRDVAYASFREGQYILTNALLGKARAATIYGALKVLYWLGDKVYIPYE